MRFFSADGFAFNSVCCRLLQEKKSDPSPSYRVCVHTNAKIWLISRHNREDRVLWRS